MNKFLIVDPDEFWAKMEKLIEERPKANEMPKWLRSADVKEMLNISDSTLQTMRINGSIPARKLGNTWFYRYDEIIDALEQGKTRKGGEENEKS